MRNFIAAAALFCVVGVFSVQAQTMYMEEAVIPADEKEYQDLQYLRDYVEIMESDLNVIASKPFPTTAAARTKHIRAIKIAQAAYYSSKEEYYAYLKNTAESVASARMWHKKEVVACRLKKEAMKSL